MLALLALSMPSLACDDVCALVQDVTAEINTSWGSAVLTEQAPEVRRRPSNTETRVRRIVNDLNSGGCTVQAAVQDHAAGTYGNAAFTGTTATSTVDGLFENRRISGQVAGGPAFGDSFGRYKSTGKLLARRDDGGFLAGIWIRVAGSRGAFVAIQGTCDGVGTIPESLGPWWGGSRPSWPTVTCPSGQGPLGESCVECPLGTASADGSSCEPCAAGTFASITGLQQCTPCVPGSFTATEGSTQCTSCDAGTIAADFSSESCSLCPDGTFTSEYGGYFCYPCPEGTVSDPTHQTCVTPGIICDPGRAPDGEGDCQDCPAGTHSPDGVTCLPCAPGSSTPLTGRATCKLCPSGRYSPAPGGQSCAPCPAGSFSDAGAESCTLCAPGTAAPQVGQNTCYPCEIGSFAPNAGSQSCSSCAPGTYADTDGSATCKPCQAGTFAAVEGLPICAPCQAGRFASQSGSQSCESCAPGTHADTTGSIECTACGPGTAAPLDGMAICDACSPGTFAAEPGAQVCEDCPAGTFSDLFASISCIDCEPGTYNPNTQKVACLDCPLVAEAGAEECRCPPGTGENADGTACDPCPAGEFSVDGTCHPCFPGSYSTAPGSLTCELCPTNTFQADTGATNCQWCGMYEFTFEEGSIACHTCPENHYRSLPDPSLPDGECVPCPSFGVECAGEQITSEDDYIVYFP